MRMTFGNTLAVCGGPVLALVVLAGCGERGKDERAAFEACLGNAKKDQKFAKAQFAPFDKANVQGSTGDAGLRVNIPYEMDGKKGTYQCVAEKQSDGTFKVTF